MKQNPKEPVWVVHYQNVVSQTMSSVLGADGKPFATHVEYGPEDEMTVHAKDEAAARAYLEGQNPGIKIIKAEKV